jgi:tetratricopeptide (TPR) repeat protein
MQRMAWMMVLLLVHSGPLAAQQAPEWATCRNGDLKIEADVSIEACNTMLSRGGLTPGEEANVYHSRGRGQETKRNYNSAVDDYARAIELSPNVAESYIGRGNALRNNGEAHLAIADYDKSIQLKPRIEGYTGRGLTYERLDKRDLAIADFRSALALDANDRISRDGLRRLGVSP